MGNLQMPAIRLLAAALVAFLPMSACARPEGRADETRSSGPGVAFASGSFDEALTRARNEKRILLVDVYTDWCGWCKKLDREVFADSRVAEAARSLIAVRINAEKGDEKVAQRYDVQGYPTVLFLDGSGNVVKRIDGFVDAAEMLRIISALPKA
jgi:thiol:disulfide interchange protein